MGPVRAAPSHADVVVVGAGAAGIAAARQLLAGGLDCVVLEAADRVGGRAYTESESFGLPFDHGCAWLQGPATLPHLALAQAAGFTLVDHANPPGALFTRSRPANPSEEARYEAASEQLRQALAEADGDVAAADFLDDPDPWMAAAATWLGPMDHGVDLANLSSADVAAYGDYDVNLLVREGLGALVARSAAGLPVLTGVAVTGIDWSGAGVVVQTSRGDIRARAAIVTVSTGVLASGSIRFTPDLPPERREALAALPMGLLTKIALQIDGARFGVEDNAFLTRSIHDPLPARAAFFLAFPTGSNLCVGFAGGQVAWEIEREGEDAAIAFATSELASMLGEDVRRHVRRGRMTRWADNPFTLGAYAAARPGRHHARAALAEPLGERVFFAGEAFGGAYPALLSGAHLSGEATARRLAETLSGARTP
jgi:monoamine oxidase